jgi:AAA15 family ATPase/GTPase
MHLRRLRISNFRSIEDIDVEFDALVNVIIGPNAIGKTTVLEAIRVAKAILAARTPNEATQTLNSLGVTSPHMPQRIFPNALTTDARKPTIIKLSFNLERDELDRLRDLLAQLAGPYAQQSAGMNFANPAQAAAFFSSEEGQAALRAAQVHLNQGLQQIEAVKQLELNLKIDYASNSIAGENLIAQTFFAGLEQSLRPDRALFSYFPADRAMPSGEQPVQLGLADTNTQLESYNSQPQIKYGRLKHTIFSSIIGSNEGREEIKAIFSLIFDRILKGRALGEIGLNNIGMLSIPILDTETGATFDIDGLSSGEKGLILTFLLLHRSVARNGVVLLDEPELHLNPAVCRDLLQFLVDEFAIKHNMQAIICSHSAEILAGAFERDHCSLFHLRGGKTLAKVRQHDRGEIRDALRRLGSSESEALLYKGTVSVEGIHDVEVLHAGFGDIFRRFRLRERGGRGQVEKDILELQKAEEGGDEIGKHYFIFDYDRKPTALKESLNVRFLQLERYCLENYLLDIDIITDLTREREFSAAPINNVTDTRDAMKRLALGQLNEVCARKAFNELGLEAVAFDMSIFRGGEYDGMAQGLSDQITEIQTKLTELSTRGIASEFQRVFDGARQTLRLHWDENWREQCNGKKLFEDMREEGLIKGDLLRLKKRISTEMRNRTTETWRSLSSLLTNLVRP